MFGRVRGMMASANAMMAKADALMARGNKMMADGEAILKVATTLAPAALELMKFTTAFIAALSEDVPELLDDVQDGIDFKIVYGKFEPQEDGGTALPLKIRMVIDEKKKKE